MLHAHVFVFQPLRLVLSFDKQLVQPLRNVKPLAGGGVARNARDVFKCLLNLGFKQFGCDLCLFKQVPNKATLLLEQSQHQVLDVHGLVLQTRPDVLRLGQRLPGFLGKVI